jgi:hypothetical protein
VKIFSAYAPKTPKHGQNALAATPDDPADEPNGLADGPNEPELWIFEQPGQSNAPADASNGLIGTPNASTHRPDEPED